MTIKAVVFDAYGTLYDVQSVADVTEDAFPGYGEIITQVWRIKQLEYTWLRSLMRRYQDFSRRHARLAGLHAAHASGCEYDDDTFARIIDKYLHLDLYPDALAALSAMKDRKLAILSNGSPDMLNALVRNSGLDRVLDADHQRRCQEDLQAQPRGLHADRGGAARAARARCCSSPPIPGTPAAPRRSGSTSPGSSG